MVPAQPPSPERSTVSERDERRRRTWVRAISGALALALVAWALAEDDLIGGGPGFGFTQAVVMGAGLLLAASCLAPLAWNARALALVISTFFVLAVGEIGVRVLFSPRYRAPNQFDAERLYSLVPGAVRETHREAINGGDRIVYRVDSDGFRGEELEAHPTLRVAVYGDSFIHGEFSSLENTFAERLERHLSERLGVDVEVVNAGVAGYGPDQELRKLEHELPWLHPDLVVVAIFTGNDFGDLLRNKLYRIGADGRLVENHFTITPDLRRDMEVQRRESLLKRVVREAVFGVAVRLGLRQPPSGGVEKLPPRERLERFRDQHLREYQEYVVQGDDVVRELAWDSYDADVSLTPKSDAARYQIELMDRVIGRMQEVTAAASVPLVLLPIPHPIDVGGHDTGEVDRARYPDYRPRGLVSIIEGIASRRGIPCVDLFTPFSKRGSKEVYFHGFDDHWNDHGQDVAGDVVADFLVSHGLLAAPAPAAGRAGAARSGS